MNWQQFVEAVKNLYLEFHWTFILQFILFAVLFYYVFKLLKYNKNNLLIVLITFIIVLSGCAFSFSKNVSSEVLLIVLMLIATLIFTMYHTEIKRSMLDSQFIKKNGKRAMEKNEVERIINEVIKATQNMSKNDIGALIVLSDGNLPEGIIESGTIVNAEITSQMIEAIFYPKAPLHDGALVIEGYKLYAGGCFLPIAQSEALPKELGSRHRAAIGVTNVASVTAIVVSEETGIISIMKNGQVFKRYADASDLRNVLNDFYWSDMTAQS